MTTQPDNFDAFLTAALRAQPEPAPRTNLAAAAIQIAKAHDARLARIASIKRWTRFVTAAAAILILATLITGYLLLPRDTTTTTDSTTTLTDSSTDTTISTATSSTLDWSTLGLGALAATIVAITLSSLLSNDRPSLQLAAEL